jgi:class I fructose-bisphosphate aldolase
MYRLFRENGRSVVVAMDHGLGSNVYPGLADPSHVIDAVVAGGADAVLTTFGILKQFYHQMKSVGVILRMDGGNSELMGGPLDMRLLYSVEDALRLGADSVACMGFPGCPLEPQTLGNVATLAGQCQTWGVPLMAEMLPGGFVNPTLNTSEHTRLAVRLGIELGADLIKTRFPGSSEPFGQVVENCYRPVLVLGGSVVNEVSLLTSVESAMAAGAAGVVVGRNIWGHADPQAMVEAICKIVHQNSPSADVIDWLISSGKIEPR